jgi:hypothetical protein
MNYCWVNTNKTRGMEGVRIITKMEGDWIDDQKAGHGVFIWPTGDRYELRYSQML